jgi:Domain of unknown function (DUF5753)
VETGSRAPSLDFAARADEVLGTGGLLARPQPFVRAEAYPAWFRDWVEIERDATSLRWFEPLLVPGLLQTEEYARAVLAAAHPAAAEGEVDRLVGARMDRQAILARDDPPLMWVIIDEGVLTRPVGGARVMRDQIGRLIAATRQPKIMLQVLPVSAGPTRAWTAGSPSPTSAEPRTSPTWTIRWPGRWWNGPTTWPG